MGEGLFVQVFVRELLCAICACFHHTEDMAPNVAETLGSSSRSSSTPDEDEGSCSWLEVGSKDEDCGAGAAVE